MLLLALALLAAAPLPQDKVLEERVAERDAMFFETFFEKCDADRLASMLDPDFFMIHDLDGVVAKSAEQFVEIYRRRCAGGDRQ